MKNKSVVILTTVLLAFIFYICHISLPAAPREKSAHHYVESQTHKGKVITTMDSGGYTYIEFEEKGKIVRVRGKVVKFIPRIMGRNWIHIQDGTGKQGSDDLNVTSTDTAKPGDVVLVSGKIAYNKDFGAGYLYPVIIEDASVIVE